MVSFLENRFSKLQVTNKYNFRNTGLGLCQFAARAASFVGPYFRILVCIFQQKHMYVKLCNCTLSSLPNVFMHLAIFPAFRNRIL